MHLKSKQLSFLGLLLAISTILFLIGSYTNMSTLFFIAAASFCLGIAIYETTLMLGFGFFIAGTALVFILSPNKFHCFTYCGLCFYIFILELLRKKTRIYMHQRLLWIIKFAFLNLCYTVPVLYFFKDFLLSSSITWNAKSYVVIVLSAQVVFFLYDMAYRHAIPLGWLRLKQRIRL